MACAAVALGAGAAAADPCVPWPGEPRPLPRVDDPDELRRRWARLRVQELGSAARELEGDAPVRAHHLWRRVLCLDPAHQGAVAGLARTPLVSVHQPVLVTRPTQDGVADAWAGLARPLRVTFPQPAAPEPATPEPAAPSDGFAARLATLEEQVRRARFEEALAEAGRVREAATGPEQSARVEVLAATAALALGRSDEADTYLGRALEADPQLALDPVSTPPKVRRALERVRAERTR